MGYSLRKNRRRPKTHEEFFDCAPSEILTRNISYPRGLSESEEEGSSSSSSRQMAYRGTSTSSNPNLSPAAFPTLTCRSEREQIDVEKEQLSSASNTLSKGEAYDVPTITHMAQRSSQSTAHGGAQRQHRLPVLDKNRERNHKTRRSTSKQSRRFEKESTDWNSKLNTAALFENEMETSEEDEPQSSKVGLPISISVVRLD